MTQHRSVVPLAMFYMINITTYQYFIYFTSPRDEEGSSLFQCEGVKSFTQFRWNAKRKTKRKYIGVKIYYLKISESIQIIQFKSKELPINPI